MAELERGNWQPSGSLGAIPIVVFDTETTGFYPFAGDQMISIAARRLDTGEEFASLINPGRRIPAEVVDLTGITDDMVRDAPPAAAILEQFFGFVGRAVTAAHYADFDRLFVDAKLRKLGRLRWVHPMLDTHLLAKVLYPHWRDYRLEHCASLLQTRLEGRHTALGDTRSTALILDALLAEAHRRGLSTWEQIHARMYHSPMI